MEKCSEVLHCNDGLSDKRSNVIRRHIDNMKFLFIYSLDYIFLSIYIWFYKCLILYFMYFYCYVCVFLSYVYVPTGTLRLH